jgi:hypothetical protein
MSGPPVERQAHFIEVVVFIVDAGYSWHSMVEDALGKRVGHTELREASSASPPQVVRRERADAVLREGFQVARNHASDDFGSLVASPSSVGMTWLLPSAMRLSRSNSCAAAGESGSRCAGGS